MVLKSEAKGRSRFIYSSDHPKLSRNLLLWWDAATPLLNLLLHDNYPSSYSSLITLPITLLSASTNLIPPISVSPALL